MVESAAATTGSTVTPNDSAAALRIGWILAEVRGRLDPAADQTDTPNPAPPVMLLDAANERSAVERQVEAVKVLATLSQGGTTDMKLSVLTFSTDWVATGDTAVTALTASGMLRYLASRLIWSRTGKDLSGTLGAISPVDATSTERSSGTWWTRLALFLWAWDEAIQDQFATQPFGTASSYELGRGLAESYWALFPAKGGPSSWGFLLGKPRVDALSENCRRLAPIIGTLTAGAVEATIRSWGDVAAKLATNPGSYADPEKALLLQITVWRDLLVTGRDPLTMVDPHDLAKVARRPWPLVRAFGWELALVFLGALAIGLAAAYATKIGTAFLTALGAVGITGSAVVGWAKNNVQKVADRVRNAVNLDAVVQAVTRLPPPAGQPAAPAAAGAPPPPPAQQAA